MANCIRNIYTKNYQNLIIVFQVTIERVGCFATLKVVSRIPLKTLKTAALHAVPAIALLLCLPPCATVHER